MGFDRLGLTAKGLRRVLEARFLGIFGGPAGVRTLDPKIKSLVLYQLSYRPIRGTA